MLVPNVNKMYRVYGEWSFALKDYVDMGNLKYLNRPEFEKLAEIIDPLSYNDRIAHLPKYVICAAGDEFFLPDSPNEFWSLLKGPKYLRVVPDAEHSLIGQQIDVALSILTFYKAHIYNLQVRRTCWDL